MDLKESEPEAEAEAEAASPSAAEPGPSAAAGFAALQDEQVVEEATAADREPEAEPASDAATDPAPEEPEAAPAPKVRGGALGWLLGLGSVARPRARHLKGRGVCAGATTMQQRCTV